MTTLTRCSSTMTESGFLSWIRSALRSKSLRWKPRNDCIQQARRPYKGANKLQKWEVACAICNNWYKLKEIHVDHYPKEAGSILSVADIGEFCNNLFCEVDNLRCLCEGCHSIHTLASKNNLSWEEAITEKTINKIFTEESKEGIIMFIQMWDWEDQFAINNEVNRKAAMKIIYEEVLC